MSPKQHKQAGTILHVINSLDIGGAERVAIDLCLGLSQRGRRSILATIEGGGPLEEIVQANNIPYFLMKKKPGFRPSLTIKFLRLFREQNIQTIITHNYSPFRYATIANVLGGNKPLIHVHHARSFAETDEKRPIRERLLALFAKKIVAVSEDLRQSIIAHDNIPPDKVCVIANGINEKVYNAPVDVAQKKASLGLKEKTLVIGCCARLSEQKGHTYLLQALALYNKNTHEDWHLLLVGDGELRKKLEDGAKQLGIAEKISFLGSRMDVPELLKVMDIFILTSVWEGMPLTILEAMAAGRAIVCTNVGGVSEVITTEKEGILVPPQDVLSIANAIQKTANSLELRNELSSKAQQKFIANFSLSRTLDHYEEILL
ncbi:MAG: glycosyltransferase [Desulfobulbaceae bacterium]|nr:glycosyltransferase [Desulfobulbaceae bacterium]